ncbi:DUF4055 domain-containing protein [Pseudogemmobacter faecipullorum]|uniref:DUF4055 domain-containing protein n=1 Tax=Pseudogemmobacter faecipullorum TaxID=2755041 RepID=A0ABS8CQW0_9RHOB|nr:DUF4055 domain-containing protein [Pseudogemmobacter faecipullorum]MCB5411789.1 DUF4055 domain-containing protein [Pseudogemmobacter faecipullorum]
MPGVDSKHPQYTAARQADWRLMRDAMDGESAVKARGETYLPKPSGYAALSDGGTAAYDAYRKRAEFPELVAPAVSGMAGVAHAKEISIELPTALEYLWEDANGDGMPLEEFHRQITRELLVSGRHAVLADAPAAGGEPYLASYVGESLINWDRDFYVLDESGPVRDGFEWVNETRFRVLRLDDGRYVQEVYGKDAKAMEGWASPSGAGGVSLDFIPFAVASAVDLRPDIRTPPLIGVARAALSIYQLDADYRHQLYWSGQETLVVINGEPPEAVGAGACIALQGGEDATPDVKYVGPTCAGIDAHLKAIEDKRRAAAHAGAKLLEQSEKAQESGEARKLRFQSETATLQSIVRSGCALLEAGLRFIARMKGLDPASVTVPVPESLMDSTLSPADAQALMALWLEGAISYETYYENLQRGGIASPERKAEEEFALAEKERERRELGDEGGDDTGADGLKPGGEAA